MKRFPSLFLFSLCLGLIGCASYDYDTPADGQYWQRASVSDAAYQQGPKAQQMLNRDISRCVTELRELDRLGVIKGAIPRDLSNHHETRDHLILSQHDIADREGYLFSEHREYYDFENCMASKGWERVEHLPYDVLDRADATYKTGLEHLVEDRIVVRKERAERQSNNDYAVNQ